jgi:SAM-dependent methyltransferase
MDTEFRLDDIIGHPLPVLLARGWCTDETNVEIALEYVDGTRVAPSVLCRELRPDVVEAKKANFPWAGFLAEFHLVGRPKSLQLFGKTFDVPDAEHYGSVEPHYRALYETERVLHREEIYCVGLPIPTDPVIVDLASALLSGSILDFGCGTGDLVAKLRALGRDAVGIEIDRPPIREHMSAEAAPFLSLYDGSLPMAYPDQAFDSVIATEVVEHVDDPHAVARELMRVARTSIFITVPDISAIPLSWPTNTVPWHLLESSHLNFFNPKSLSALFRPHFVPAKQMRIFNNRIGPYFIPGSIAILFTRA